MAALYVDEIARVCEFTSLDPLAERSLVVAWLKMKQGSVAAVVAAYFDDEAKFRSSYTWDESAFAADRDGVPTFTVQGPDEAIVVHGVSPSILQPAPSRPPSRTQSPTYFGTSKTQEDIDLERAMSESRAMSGVQSPHETGIVQAGSPHDVRQIYFGPAERKEYDPVDWTMVQTTRENPEPVPSGRKRQQGAPAFLRSRRPEWDGKRLGPILTILHEIPMARNALLQSGVIVEDFGSDKEWWKGERIYPQTTAGGELSALESAPTEELHRLMAFLDDTDRSYGTADSLAVVMCCQQDSDHEKTFFDQTKKDLCYPLWTGMEVVPVDGDGAEAIRTQSFGMLDFRLSPKQYSRIDSLYGALDSVLWPQPLGCADEGATGEGDSKMSIMYSTGNVITLRFDGQAPPHHIHIPETLYLDRYLASNKDRAVGLQRQLRTVYRALERSTVLVDQLTKWVDNAHGKVHHRRDMSKRAVNLHQGELLRLQVAAAWRRHEELRDSSDDLDFVLSDIPSEVDLNDEEEKLAQHYAAEATIHEKKVAEIDRKLQQLKAEQRACERLLSRLNTCLTNPSRREAWEPTNGFSLRGISTASNITYVCRRTESDEPATGAGLSTTDRWWKLAYLPHQVDPVVAEETRLVDVLHAAFEEGDKKPVLIYAKDEAMTEQRQELPAALKTFVRIDNRFFRHELIEESPREKKRSSNQDPESPPKRQQRLNRSTSMNSIDSMASNRASLGDLSDRDDDTAMANGADLQAPGGGARSRDNSSLGTEMVQLAISHQPGLLAVEEKKDDDFIADWDNPEGVSVSADGAYTQ